MRLAERTHIDDRDMPWIVGRLQRVRPLLSVDFGGNRIGDGGAVAIAETLQCLKSLDISLNTVGDAGARAISQKLLRLETLRIGVNHVGDRGATAIAQRLRYLTSLDIEVNRLGAIGARAIARGLMQLTRLNISNNRIGASGARAIGQHLGELAHLCIAGNAIGAAGAKTIARSLRRLRSIDVRRNGLGEEGARAIGTMGWLNVLNIAENCIGDAGARSIAESLAGVHTLYVGANSVGDAGARCIANDLRGLRVLGIAANLIGDAGVVVELCDAIMENAYSADVAASQREVSIDVRDNPVRWGNTEVVSETILCETDPAKLRGLLLKLRQSGATSIYTARGVMAGPSMHGKTHLCRWLTTRAECGSGEWEELKQPIPKDDRTWGSFASSTWLLPKDHGRTTLPSVLLRVIDCGGQLEQLQSHRNLVYMGSRRSVFILCVRADRGFGESWADYHLGLIGSLRQAEVSYQEGDERPAQVMSARGAAERIPVLLVVTHADLAPLGPKRRLKLPSDEAMRRDYPLLDVVKVEAWNALEGHDLAEVKRKVGEQLAKLKEMHAAMPAAIERVRKMVEEYFGAEAPPGAPVMRGSLSLGEFERLCAKCGESGQAEQEYYLRELHNLGYLVAPECYKRPLPKDLRVVSPVLVQRYLGTILKDGEAQSSDGFLSEKQYEELLETVVPGLGREDRMTLEELMRVSLTAFEREAAGGGGRIGWFVPDLLSMRPDEDSEGRDTVCSVSIKVTGFLGESVFFGFLRDHKNQLVLGDITRGEALNLHRDECTIRLDDCEAVVRFDVRRKVVRIAVRRGKRDAANVCARGLAALLRYQIEGSGAKAEVGEITPGAVRKRGRPRRYDPAKLQKLAADLEEAKANATTKAEFCDYVASLTGDHYGIKTATGKKVNRQAVERAINLARKLRNK